MYNFPQSSGSPVTQAPFPPEEFNRRFGELAERWYFQGTENLELRYQLGELLNQQYGGPTTRQQRGAGTLEREAERLGVHVSEISRMRKFAFHFKSFEDFKMAHPEATWTTVKGKILPKLKSEDEKQEKESGNGTKPSKVKPEKRISRAAELEAALLNLSSTLRVSRKEITEKEKGDLQLTVQDLVEALKECLQIQLVVQLSPEATSAADRAA